MDITYYDSWEDIASKNSGHCFFISTKAPRRYTDMQYSDGTYLVFGREDEGLPESLLQQHQAACVRLPMRDAARSLNLSNTVAVAVYEALRQWDFPDLLDHGQPRQFQWDEP